jgi:predicted HTH domain antitoxin
LSERLSIVITPELKEEIDLLVQMTQLDKSALVRMLLRRSIRDVRVEQAIKAYEDGKVSFGKASEIAGLNMWEWIDEVHKNGVQWQFSAADAQAELDQRRVKKQ